MATALDPQAEQLRQIHTFPQLVKYLDEELGWPVGVDNWEDAVYDWQPEELNLKAEHQVAVKSIKQLRPLVSGQPWGIFFVDFDKGKLPIVVLRRMLNGLAIKSRVKGSGHQTWLARDLLFISSFGEAKSREIALAHFTDESDVGDMPTLRVLGWDEADTALELSYVAKTLKEKMRWPAHTASKIDQEAWRTQWASAFSLKYRQVINDSKSLALALAELAKRIRSRVNAVLALESDKGHLRQLHNAFKDNLISDLTEDGFADMYAQTITYGLFAARASRGSGALVADDAALMAPSTNPFLRDLLQDFLHAGGRAKRLNKRVDFDELGINEVVTTLRDVPMDAVLRSFNATKPGDDPVIHFYEDFLKAYDKKMRAKRGVFYTPSPVVQYIVRSVDEILKTEFGIEDGLASTITWGEMMARKPELQLPKFCTPDTAFVQVLDPATGTGTFIVEVINQVHAHMLAKWAKQGKVAKPQWLPLWVEYVKTHLLPRLYAFELMMAPYAIAHMKIGLKLAETGYTFPENGPRVNVFLTNALEPSHAVNPGLEFEAPMLAHEAVAANHAKEQLAATVVIGNPPYSVSSSNKGDWIVRLCADYKKDLNEKNIQPLSDDYIKFIRLGQYFVDRTATGVLGYIINNSYIDGIIHRRMRQSLTTSFNQLYVLDLHGSTKKKETTPDGDKDENVFDIMQGVNINLFAKTTNSQPLLVNHSSLQGLRAAKYAELLEKPFPMRDWKPVASTAPEFGLTPKDTTLASEYALGMAIDNIFQVNSTGVKTHRDDFVIDIDERLLSQRIKRFFNSSISDRQTIEELNLKDNRDWSMTKARAGQFEDHMLIPISYRPFDTRHIYYDGELIDFDRREVMQHMLHTKSLALISVRQVAEAEGFNHVQASRHMTDNRCMFSSLGTALEFPLWIYTQNNKSANFSKALLNTLQSNLNQKPADYRAEDLTAPLHAEKIFHYIYAVLHSPAYRNRYAAFLRTDFPRIPIPGSLGVFNELAKLGEQLVQWHLLEHPDAIKIIATQAINTPASGQNEASNGQIGWFGTDFELTKVAEKSRELAEMSGDMGKVFVNATSGFANVKLSTWQHTIGGYQVLHKWLDDRRKAKRSLSQDDITHWLRVYAALVATQGLMLQVDEAIEANGGWPGAFSQNHPPPDAATLAAEQMVQKEQLKAQKKAATATKKRAASVSPTGATSLFDYDDDLDALAAASGEPPNPKSKATPAKAAGGKAQSSAAQVNDITDGQTMCAIRAVLARSEALSREELIRLTARELGFARTSPRIARVLDGAVRTAVRRGVADNAKGTLGLLVRDMAGYESEHLKTQMLVALRADGGTCLRSDAPKLLARALGFARTGTSITDTVESILRSLVRAGQIESKAGQIQILKKSST